ncbi:uncharacterized protein LOC126793543 [Argentina anserina]|uniref:uncharacterized protein LOC126793543 n=1 Tax=Argentina anserina TaxID=57926 RepID=UPI00217690FD|nr:uncharacterized protein LOC126793543 [Potentilla anserina]
MATEKMHRCLLRTNNDSQKLSISRNFKENNSLRTSLEDWEAASVARRNFDRRSDFLTFLALGPDGIVRIVSLPLRYPDCTNSSGSGAQVNVESLRLFYTKPPDPLKVIRPKVQQGSQLAGSFFGSSFMNNFALSYVRHQSPNKELAHGAMKQNEVSRESYQKSVTCSTSAFSSMIETGSSSNNFSDTASGSEKVDKVKRNSRKKSRNKGKKGKKISGASSSTKPHFLSVECADGSLASEICGNSDGDRHWGPVSLSTAAEVLLLETGNESPKPCISHHAALEVDIPFSGNLGHQGVLQDSEFPIKDGVGSIPHTEMDHCNDLHTRGYSDMHDSFVMDSISVGSSCDDYNSDGHDEKHAEKEIHRLYEVSSFSSKIGYVSNQSLMNDVLDTHDSSEGMRHGIQNSYGDDMKSAVPSKRSNHHETEKTSANFLKLGSTVNLHVPTVKGKNHSVWQKVQKNGENDCNWELMKESSVYSQNFPTLVESAFLNRSSTAVRVKVSPKSGQKMQQEDGDFKELKRKDGPPPKQIHCAQKGAYANIPGSDGCLKARMEQNDMSDVLSPVKDNKGSSLVSGSCSRPSSPRVFFQRHKEGCVTSDSVHGMQLSPNEMDHVEGVCATSSAMNNPIPPNQDNAMQKISESLGEFNMLQVQPQPIYLPHLLCDTTSPAEGSRIYPSFGCVNHMFVPTQLEDPVTSSNSSLAHVHSEEPADKSWTSTDTAKEITQNISSGAAVDCVSQCSGDVTCYSDTTEDMLPKIGFQDPSTIEELKDKLIAAECINFESKDLNAVEAESNRILEAVHNAYRAQLASEAVQMVTGDPIAEFERLLYHSSPVIPQSPNFIRCQICSMNLVTGFPICRHETTTISLGCLWKWYQRIGSYGLEIRTEDFRNSKGVGADRCAFHAYFVPYLSAIQLFQRGRSDAVCSTEVLGVKSENLSNLVHLPINSISFPLPGKENQVGKSLVHELCISQQSSAPANDSIQITSAMGSSDLDLLFEYFESQQPQQRQPLYDKIKELIRGDRPDLIVYGDPTKLETINLNDLHPRSWYSVAWYPIYRIPNGNLRAAFLTYHSLGHLVVRSANFECPSVDAHIVSPVVGLQSYNAQDECWFQPRHSGPRQTSITPGPGINSVDGILRERLRTLDETASLMAKAVVKKGSMTSVNRHPDYEFFLSRRR